MNFRAILYVLALLLLLLTSGLVGASVVSAVMGDGPAVLIKMLLCAGVTAFCGIILLQARRLHDKNTLKPGIREGFAIVALAWIVASALGGLPFVFVANMTFADAFFETASGFTTTGASVIADTLRLRSGETLAGGLEALPYGLLFWRSLLNWLGGVGIVFFVLLILPLMNVGVGNQLYNAEVPGLKNPEDDAAPRLSSSVRLILLVYLLLTTLAALSYWGFGMTLFDAICHSFSTVSTGGFSTKSASIGYYTSPKLQWSVIFFMFVSSCNFSLIINLFRTRRLKTLKDEEFMYFGTSTAIAICVVTWLLYAGCPVSLNAMTHDVPHAFEPYLRSAAFQITTIVSTTGFVTSDYETWHIPAVTIILFSMMFVCGCGGSTAGGIKCVRIIVIIKQMLSEVRHCFFPRAVLHIRLNNGRVSQSLVSKTLAFAMLYIFVFMAVSSALPFLTPMNVKTAFGAAIACLSNIGPGMGRVGPVENYAWMSASAKYLLAITMITGRLELYTIFVLFMPSFWRR